MTTETLRSASRTILKQNFLVLFGNFSDDEYYNLPSHLGNELWVLDNLSKNYQVFSARLLHLLEIGADEWWLAVSKYAEYLIHCSDILPQEFIRQEMVKTLEAKVD